MAIGWSIVNRSDEPLGDLRDEIRAKISKLEELLAHFPDDAVHLQIVLGPKRKDKAYDVTLNLRVPSDVLQTTKDSRSPASALDGAMTVLVRRLKKLKSRYRRDYLWKRHRFTQLPERPTAFAGQPVPESVRPGTFDDLVVDVLRSDYRRLLGFVARQLNQYALSGMIAEGVIDPADIVHEVAEEALRHPERKPTTMDYHTWCSSLAFRATRRAVRRHLEDAHKMVPVELDVRPQLGGAGEEDLEPEEFALNLLQEQLEPQEATLADLIPDPAALPPDSRLQEEDMVGALRAIVRSWPKLDREMFEMYFLEGFSPTDIAMTFQCEPEAVDGVLSRIRARLRARLSDVAAAEEPVGIRENQERAFADHISEIAEERRREDERAG